jgi:bacterioferritin (cytochrome b1)
LPVASCRLSDECFGNREPVTGNCEDEMTAIETTNALTEQQLGLIYQYTIEAYKAFEKLAENLPNPLSATMFKQFAVDEREQRDLLEMKIMAVGATRVRATLAGDLQFQASLEGELSFRETTEFLINRERTMEKKLVELSRNAPAVDRNLLIYLAAGKRAHIVQLERELELIKVDRDWFKREDAQWRIVHGSKPV